MVYTTPRTWVTGEPITADLLNTHLKGNLEALKDPPTDSSELDLVANITTNSTSWVDVDSTNLSLSITTTGGDILVGFFGHIGTNAGVSTTEFGLNLSVDGTDVAADDGIVVLQTRDNYYSGLAGFVYLVRGEAAGAHTIKLRWKVTGSHTLTLYAGAGTSDFDMHSQFWAKEL